MDNLEFNKYKKVLVELNKLGLDIIQNDSTSFTRIFDFKILKYSGIDEDGVVKFNSREEFIMLLKKLKSSEISQSIISRIDNDLQRLSINADDEFYVKFFAS
ncbi:hypothetical protein [Flagellimonas sediminis]|uniref:Uncharacterized protein n=1 Tax=Flagellimonas sediminis TaxID=2696468 RepID=A0A6I5KT19_9FLAO|nr:hypothetical protein [Allomuricauda sediminis]NDV43135.1 hypothetical protein [Allomuricauda sediminis]